MRENRSVFANIDWFLVLLYLLLILMGWGNIYAAVFNEENSSIMDMSQEYGRQLIWILTSLFLAILILFTDGKIFQALAYPIYFVSLLTLLGVLLFGKEVAGARSWFAIGSFSLQPSEFAK
ncbi:MAG TPA: rod shape-determining protein RodA, partial [Cryomorphaceae bacterium]|nr:rod shape-determining protein RodA [Cryomorphaceae bacterium]